jgi:hypothetical protein
VWTAEAGGAPVLGAIDHAHPEARHAGVDVHHTLTRIGGDEHAGMPPACAPVFRSPAVLAIGATGFTFARVEMGGLLGCIVERKVLRYPEVLE